MRRSRLSSTSDQMRPHAGGDGRRHAGLKIRLHAIESQMRRFVQLRKATDFDRLRSILPSVLGVGAFLKIDVLNPWWVDYAAARATEISFAKWFRIIAQRLVVANYWSRALCCRPSMWMPPASRGSQRQFLGTGFPRSAVALAVAQSGDTIKIAGGVYKPTNGTDRTATFAIATALELDGGYAGNTNSADPDARDAETYVTTLSGNIGTNGASSDNSFHVITASGSSTTVTLDSLSIVAGNTNGANSPDGAGVTANVATLVCHNCTFTANTATFGGGIYVNGVTVLSLTGCTFTSNGNANNLGNGGAVFVNTPFTQPAQISGCTFTANSASGGGAVCWGNGQSQTLRSISITSCTFIRNSATFGGGVEIIAGNNPSFTNCLFEGNVAKQNGGGIVVNTGRTQNAPNVVTAPSAAIRPNSSPPLATAVS